MRKFQDGKNDEQDKQITKMPMTAIANAFFVRVPLEGLKYVIHAK